MDTDPENAVATTAKTADAVAVIDGAAADIAATVDRNAPAGGPATDPANGAAAAEPVDTTAAVAGGPVGGAVGGAVRDGRGRFVPRPGSRPRKPRPAAADDAAIGGGRSTVIDPASPGSQGGATAPADQGEAAGGDDGNQELGPEAAEVLADRTFDLAESLVGEKARPTDGERSAVKSAANKCLGGMRIPWWAALALPLSFWGLRVLVIWNKDRKEKQRAKDGNAHGNRRDDGIGQKPMGKGPVVEYV